MTAIVVLGMHRSGTSCVAGMLAAAGVASAGQAVRNWDNARGHHEMLEVVRLNEAVLAHSGGHYLAPPADVRWTEEHAAVRDRLLASRVDDKPALLKDPRALLVLPFWRASRVPFHVVGVVRHPLAVARSLAAWRELPLEDGIALWFAHVRALAADRARFGYELIDFEWSRDAVIDAVVASCEAAGIAADRDALASGYAAELVHHDAADAPPIAGLAEATALYRGVTATTTVTARRFPRADVDAGMRALAAGDRDVAVTAFARALASAADPAAVLVPAITALLRQRAFSDAQMLVCGHSSRCERALADLLLAKILVASGDAAAALPHLEAACAAPAPYYQARHLLAQALRAAGRAAEARTALLAVAATALYPHDPLATLAEWSFLDRDLPAAIAGMQRAIAAAPIRRRGRLRTRLAEWHIAASDHAAARAQLELALAEDPAFTRSRDLLRTLPTPSS